MAKLQHMCLCECDHLPQIKTIHSLIITNKGKMGNHEYSENTKIVGPLGIEPSLHAPEACVLPVYYGPPSLKLRRAKPVQTLTVGMEGFEPSQDCSYTLLKRTRIPIPPHAH